MFVTMVATSDVGYLISPNLSVEEQRVRYVALSRAKDRLFINVPNLSTSQEEDLKSLFDICR